MALILVPIVGVCIDMGRSEIGGDFEGCEVLSSLAVSAYLLNFPHRGSNSGLVTPL